MHRPAALVGISLALHAAESPKIPQAWDDAARAEWTTPLASLNLRATHISAKAYYSWPIENLRTYPVYYPGREPDGYWAMLQHVGPKPLIDVSKLKSDPAWVEAGREVFEGADDLAVRTLDPALIAAARNRASFERIPEPRDGVLELRWIPTKHRLALSSAGCSSCHALYVYSLEPFSQDPI